MKYILAAILFFILGCNSATKIDNVEKAQLHHEIAIAHIQNTNYPLALKELLIAEELDPSNAAIQANLGLVFFAREKYELAEKHYKKAISIKSDFTDAKNNLGRIYIELGQFKSADEMLTQVLADLTYPDFPRAYTNYGVLEFKRKKFTSAISYFKKSLEKDRENCETRVYLGRSYLELNDYQLATSQLEKALGPCGDSDMDDAHFYLAITQFRNKETDKSVLRFEDLIKKFPNGKNKEKAEKMLIFIKGGAK